MRPIYMSLRSYNLRSPLTDSPSITLHYLSLMSVPYKKEIRDIEQYVKQKDWIDLKGTRVLSKGY